METTTEIEDLPLTKDRLITQDRLIIRCDEFEEPWADYRNEESVVYDKVLCGQEMDKLVAKFEEADPTDESELGDKFLNFLYSLLPYGFRVPDSVYIDGDGCWCGDWHQNDSDGGLYTCVLNESKLLIIADSGDSNFFRFPCNINDQEGTQKHIRYAYSHVFSRDGR
jgi:hypothetical protein